LRTGFNCSSLLFPVFCNPLLSAVRTTKCVPIKNCDQSMHVNPSSCIGLLFFFLMLGRLRSSLSLRSLFLLSLSPSGPSLSCLSLPFTASTSSRLSPALWVLFFSQSISRVVLFALHKDLLDVRAIEVISSD
jgi:uncharacterized membrane protein